jgi:hypothetical protein
MNSLPCGKCKYYDPILSHEEKDSGMAWCSMRSKYPHKEGPGQFFPAGVERVEEGVLAKPFIVKKTEVKDGCPFVMKASSDPTKEKQKQAKGKGPLY